MLLSVKFIRSGLSFAVGRLERLLSLLLSLAVAIVGAGFAYSSLERLMYPTPIWFTVKYASLIAATAAAKLLLFILLSSWQKKAPSSVIGVMKTDSLLDFFITLTSLISFTLTRYTEFAIDAFFGIAISVFITVNAIKMLVTAVRGVLGLIKKEQREKVFEILESEKVEFSQISFSLEGQGKAVALIELSGDCVLNEQSLKQLCLEKAGVNIITYKENKSKENQHE